MTGLELLALIGASLAGGIGIAGCIAVFHRGEIARIARSRRALAHQWQLLADTWDALDPQMRPMTRLTYPQKAALFIALRRRDNRIGQPSRIEWQPERSTR